MVKHAQTICLQVWEVFSFFQADSNMELWLFKRQLHKMVKRTQKIRRVLPTNCLIVLNHFVGLALKGLRFFRCNSELSQLFQNTAFSLNSPKKLSQTGLAWTPWHVYQDNIFYLKKLKFKYYKICL